MSELVWDKYLISESERFSIYKYINKKTKHQYLICYDRERIKPMVTEMFNRDIVENDIELFFAQVVASEI